MSANGNTERGICYRNPVRNKGFAQIPHVIALDTTLSHGAYRMYGLLAKYAQQKEKCWPGTKRLASDLRQSLDTISRYLKELVDRGLITRKRRMGRSTMTWIEDEQLVYADEYSTEKTSQLSDTSYNSPRKDLMGEEEEIEEEEVLLEPEFVPAGEEFTPPGKVAKRKIVRPGSNIKRSPLSPSTPGAKRMFEVLARESRASNRKAPQRFRTLAQKEKFEKAESIAGEKLNEYITKAVERGANNVTWVTDYVAKCAQEKPQAKTGEVIDCDAWCDGMPPRLRAGETLIINAPPVPASINPGRLD